MPSREKKSSNMPQPSGSGKQQEMPTRPATRRTESSSTSTSRSGSRPPGLASSSKQAPGYPQGAAQNRSFEPEDYEPAEFGDSKLKGNKPSQPRGELKQLLKPKLARTDSGTSASTKPSSSAPSSTRSEPVRGRFDQPVYFRNRLNIDDDFFQSIDAAYKDKLRVLMLAAGQGGTFMCGNATDWQIWKAAESNVFPMSPKWGQKLSLIGTKGCVTCTAVYMELTEGRFFAAHINVWPSTRDNFLSLEYWQIMDMTEAVTQQLKDHSAAHGWSKDDVKPKHWKLVSPFPWKLDNVVANGVREFLGLEVSPKVLTDFGGFVIRPGYPSKKTGDINMKGLLVDKNHYPELAEENVPVNFEEVIFGTIKDRTPMPQEWTYTCEKGWTELPAKSERTAHAQQPS